MSEIKSSDVEYHVRKGRIPLKFRDQIQSSMHQIFTQIHQQFL